MQRRKAQPIIANKEDGSFREALKLYESKQYKKSLKLAEGILKKNSNYSDALALKALLLFCLDEKEESELYVSKAIAKNEDSPIGNHILGILRRSQLDYKNAAVFFKKALDNGSTNKQIWKDLSVMELQTRDYTNLIKSRHAYLEEFLGYRANWTGLAIAHDLNNDYAQAEKVLTKFEQLAEGKLSDAEMFENSELQLYKNHLIGKQDVERALKDLNKLDTFDKLDELELRATYLMKLGKSHEASKVYRELLKRNPDNIKYYNLLEVALGTRGKSDKFRDGLYQKLAKFYPRSDPPVFIPLTFLKAKDPLFKTRVETYVLKQLERGVPATFTNVKPLYKDLNKSKIIEEIVLKFLNKKDLLPIVYVWTNYFLCQHFLYLGKLTEAKHHVDVAIKHTPTLVELYILKARVLKHYGEYIEAADVINQGRLLDLQDRFINSKTVKYYLRADLIDKAYEVVSIFTKNDNSVNGVKDLHLMQASWFIIENGESFYRLAQAAYKKGDVEEGDRYSGLSLKRYSGIVKIFEEYYNDQLDFHTFCLRKGTARSYLDTLKWADHVFASPIYSRAVQGASKIYFQRFDTKPVENKDEEVIDLKKQDKKAKKDKIAKQKALETERAKHLAYADDKDVFGEELLNGSLDEFQLKFFNHLWEQGQDLIQTHVLQIGLQFRLGKTGLAIGSLNKLKTLSNDAHELIPYFVLNLKYNSTQGINKLLAEKGIEKGFDIDFNKIDEFIAKYTTKGELLDCALGLVAVYKLKLDIVDNEKLFENIEEKLERLQPYESAYVKSLL